MSEREHMQAAADALAQARAALEAAGQHAMAATLSESEHLVEHWLSVTPRYRAGSDKSVDCELTSRADVPIYRG